MLETPEERVGLLKAGVTGKEIERLYISYNKFKLITRPILFEHLSCYQRDCECDKSVHGKH